MEIREEMREGGGRGRAEGGEGESAWRRRGLERTTRKEKIDLVLNEKIRSLGAHCQGLAGGRSEDELAQNRFLFRLNRPKFASILREFAYEITKFILNGDFCRVEASG